MLFIIPFLSQNVIASSSSFGDHSISLSQGTSINWMITNCSDYEISYGYWQGNDYYSGEITATIGDKFRFTYKGMGYYGDDYYYTTTSDLDPCLIATLEFYDASRDQYYDIFGSGYGLTVKAFLMQNSYENTYFTTFYETYHYLSDYSS